MSEFSLPIKNLAGEKDAWDFAAREINRKRELLNNTCMNLSITGSAADNIKGSLRKVSKQMEEIQKSTVSMKQALIDIIDFYEKKDTEIAKSILRNSNENPQNKHIENENIPDKQIYDEMLKNLSEYDKKCGIVPD